MRDHALIFIAAHVFSEVVGAIETLLAKHTQIQHAERLEAPQAPGLGLGWSALDALLPECGLPVGVTEFAAPFGLGGGSLALGALWAAQRDPMAWCAWLEPEATLYAPRLLQAGVDLERLLVVQPSRAALARTAVRCARSGAFALVVVDWAVVPGAGAATFLEAGELTVRRLALASEASGARVILLTNSRLPRKVSWPTALRLELSRPDPNTLSVCVAKDRHGRIGQPILLPLAQPFKPSL